MTIRKLKQAMQEKHNNHYNKRQEKMKTNLKNQLSICKMKCKKLVL